MRSGNPLPEREVPLDTTEGIVVLHVDDVASLTMAEQALAAAGFFSHPLLSA